MVADRGLGDVAAADEIAGADVVARGQLAQDRQPAWVGRGLEEEGIGIGVALHGAMVLTTTDIGKYEYQVQRQRPGAPE